MRIKSIVLAISLALAASLAATMASAGEPRYLGPSTATLDGGEGIFAYHRACTATFGDDAVWCTSRLIHQIGPDKDAPTPSDNGEWLLPDLVGFAIDPDGSGFFFIDYSLLGTGVLAELNCNRWRSNAGNGLVIIDTGGTGVITTSFLACASDRPAACCSKID